MKWTNEQLAAIQTSNTSIIVSAGAGSGKTTVLTERVIEKIKSGININELLILTFTNKAANEMREKIREALKEDKKYEKQLNLINEAYITTFDSFALSILKKYHYILKIPRNIQIVDASLIYLEKITRLDEIFEDLYHDENPQFLKLINDFCIKDDIDLKDGILTIYDKLNLVIDKDDYLKNYLNNFFSDKYIDELIKKYVDLINLYQEQISKYLDEVAIIDAEYYEKISNCLQRFLEANTYDEIKQSLDCSLPRLPKNADEDLKDYKEKISDIIKKLNDNLCVYDDSNEIANSYQLTKNYVCIIIDIVKKLDEKLKNYKSNNNIYEFNDISIMLIDILKNNTQIQTELKNQYNEIMIDEYQDTSDIQEELISLIANNNVYMVGDIKQSIYRFRNANPYIFKNKYEKYAQGKDGVKIDLNNNFRSRDEVVKSVNLLFSNLMDYEFGGINYNNGHEMIFGNKDYNNKIGNKNYNMEILNYNYDKNIGFSPDEIEIFMIANDILDKVKNKYQVVDKANRPLRDCTFSDFSILVDRSTNFDLVKKIFEFMQIPLTIYKDEKINSSEEIISIKNIIKLTLKIKENNFDSEFKYLFISLARCFIFEYDDNEIFKIFSSNKFTDNDIYQKCYELSKDIDTYTNTMLIDKIMDNFSILEKLIKLRDVQTRIVKLDYLNELSINLDNLDYTIADFSEYLDKLNDNGCDIKFSLSKDNPNSVKIMTIHTSKGLEFNICYFPFLDKPFNLDELKQKFVFDNEYGIITPYFKEGIGNTIAKYLLKEKYLKEEISEKIRLFYVALTRVKEKMILIADLSKQKKDYNDKNKFRNFLDMLNYLDNKINQFKIDINLDTINLSHEYDCKRKIANLNKFDTVKEKIIVKELNFDNKFEETKTFSKTTNNFISREEERKLEMGTYLHYLLENIDFKSDDIDKYKIDDFYKNKIKSFLKLPIFKNINQATIYKEYEFMENENNIKKHGIIDLMLEYVDYIDIIDYKFKNIDDENYEKQLNGYKDYIEKKTNKKVNIYLYSIIDENLKSIK